MADNWYELAKPDKQVTQGDILIDFPIIINDLPSTHSELKDLLQKQKEAVEKGESLEKPIIQAKIRTANVVILTQGCLIAGPKGPKVDQIIVAVIDDAKGEKWDFINEVMSNKRPAYHLLNKSFESSIPLNYQIVDFTNVFTVSLKFVESFCRDTGPRLRIKSPYLEELSQRFGLFFSKVGTPNENIDKADLKASI